MIRKILTIISRCFLLLFAAFSANAETAVERHEQLKTITVSTVDHWKLPTDEDNGNDSVFAMPGTHPAVGYTRFWGANFIKVNIPYLLRDRINVRNSAYTAINILGSSCSDEWVEYNIKSSGVTTHILFRYLAVKGTGEINILLDGNSIGQVSFTATPDTSWGFKEVYAPVRPGDHKLKFQFANTTGEGYYLSWFEMAHKVDPIMEVPFTDRRNQETCIGISKSKDRIVLSLPELHPYKSYTLFNIEGRTIASSLLSKNKGKITIGKLSSGTYLIKFLGKEYFSTRKIVMEGD